MRAGVGVLFRAAEATRVPRQVVTKSLNGSFWERARTLRSRMRIAEDPHSFSLYIKDLTEVRVPLVPVRAWVGGVGVAGLPDGEREGGDTDGR